MSNETERKVFESAFRKARLGNAEPDFEQFGYRYMDADTLAAYKAFQAGVAYQCEQEQPADALDEAIQDVLDHLNGGYSIHSGTGLHSILRDTYSAAQEKK